MLFALEMMEIIVGAVVFLLYIVGQLMNLKESAQAKGKPRRPPGPEDEPGQVVLDDLDQPVRGPERGRQRPELERRPVAPRPVAKPVNDQAESLRKEIEAFVQRAQGKAPPQPSGPTVKLPRPAKTATRPLRTAKPAKVQRAASPPPQSRPEGVAQHVAEHLGTSRVGTHAEQIGSLAEQGDKRLEARFQEKFDTTVGSLRHQAAPPDKAKARPDLAAEIVTLLRNPQGIRQLVIAQEIFRRPEW